MTIKNLSELDEVNQEVELDDVDTSVEEDEDEDSTDVEELNDFRVSKKVTRKTSNKKKKIDINVLDNEDNEAISNIQREDNYNNPDDRKLEIYKKLSKYKPLENEKFRTNILSLDLVLGEPYRGQIIEITSPSGVGKSTLMQQLCKNIVTGKFEPKNPRGKVAYIDTEGGINSSSLTKLGLDKYQGKQFQLLQNIVTFEGIEEVLDILLKSEERFDAIIIDSITDVIPTEMFKKSVSEIQIGLTARYQTALIQKYKPLIRQTGTTLWLVNQMRVKGKKVGYQLKFEDESAGAHILEFAPDIRLRLAKGEMIKHKTDTANGDVEVQIGTMSEIWAIKNRTQNINIRVSMPIIYGRGISDIMTMKKILFDKEFLTIGGATHTLTLPNEEPKKFTGSPKFLNYLKENLYEIRDKLERCGHWKIIDLGEIHMI